MKTKKLKMNVRLLRRIKREITAEPKRMNMVTWAARPGVHGDAAPACGTVGCIAGWGIILSSKKRKPQFKTLIPSIRRTADLWGNQIDKRGAKAFGISLTESKRLFYTSNWPEAFQSKIEKVNAGTAAYARVVCQRIDRFINTKGEE